MRIPHDQQLDHTWLIIMIIVPTKISDLYLINKTLHCRLNVVVGQKIV